MTATIWHNPQCSKSQATLALLHEAGIEVTVVDYLADPPGITDLARLLARAGLPARALLRPEGKALADADAAKILAAIAAKPSLLERPLVETPRGVRLCRPPERVRDIL